MALTCPNPNMAEWKALEKKYGYAAAMRMYEMNGEVIPSLEQAAGMEINMADGQRVFEVLPDYDMDLTNAEVGRAQVAPLPAGLDIVDGFYSPIEKNLMEFGKESQKAKEWLKVVGKGDEAVFTGVRAFIESKDPNSMLSKQEILNYMKENRIVVNEVVKEETPSVKDSDLRVRFDGDGFTIDVNKKGISGVYIGLDELDVDYNGENYEEVEAAAIQEGLSQIRGGKQGDETKFSPYQLEGEKENYKEVLVTLPQKSVIDKTQFFVDEVTYDDGTVRYFATTPNYKSNAKKTRVEAQAELDRIISTYDKIGKDNASFESPHFSEPNILVHLRMNTRTDADGKKVLFLEEIQSDWGQKGKKEGFEIKEEDRWNFEPIKRNNEIVAWKIELKSDKNIGGIGNTKEDAIKDANKRYGVEINALEKQAKGVPTAPFVMDTNAWTKLGLKFALREAVAQGADKIAWTTGTQQFDRWGTEKIDWVKKPEFSQKRYDELKQKIKEDKASDLEVDEFQSLTKSKTGGWTINIQEQFRGTAFQGMNVDEKAVTEKGTTITSKEELKSAIDRTLSREKTETERQKLTDRIWDRMQKEDSGTSLPRKEGMESFYGTETSKGLVGGVAEKLFEQKVDKTDMPISKRSLKYGIFDANGNLLDETNSESIAKKMVENIKGAVSYKDQSISSQPSIEVTPKLRAEVEQGLPRFQGQEETPPPLYTPISTSTQNYIQNLLSKVFPRVKIKFLSQQEYEARFGNTSTANVGTDGVVYLNSAKVNITTQIHEFGHVWTSWAKKYAPKLYQEGMRLAMADPDLMRQVSAMRPDLKGQALVEEALVHLIGEKGGELLMQREAAMELDGKPSLIDYIKKFYNTIKNFLKRNFNVDIRGDLDTMTVGDFAQQVAGQLLSGEYLSNISSEEIAIIEQDIGVQRNQIASAYQGKVIVEPMAGTKAIPRPNRMRIKDAIETRLRDAINAKRAEMAARGQTLTNGEIRKYNIGATILAKHINQEVEAIKKMLGDRGWGEKEDDPKHKAFTKDLVKLQQEINSGKFDDQLQQLADQILSGNYDPTTLPPAAQRFMNGYVNTMIQAQNIAINGKDIIISNNEKLSIDDASNAFKAEIAAWRGKWNAIKQINPYLGKVLQFVEDRLQDVANGQLWVKMMDGGNKNSLLRKLSNSMTRAGGVEKLHIANANDMLKSLFEKDWFRGGSQTLNPLKKLSELDTVDVKGIKLTIEEAFDVFMKFQQESVRNRVFKPTANNPNPTVKLYIPEFGTERSGQTIDFSRADYDALFAKFDPYWEDVRTTWYPSSEYILEEVNKAYEIEYGVKLGRSVNHLPTQRWNVYYPLVHGEGKDSVKTFMQKNKFLGDIGSQMYRDTDDSIPYLAGESIKVMEGYIAQNSRYAAYALPIMNINNLLKANEDFLRQNGMQSYIEWWNEQKNHIYNGDTDILGPTGAALMKGFVYSRLGLNPFVFLKQFTSVPLASIGIKSKYIMAAQKDLFGTLVGEIKNYDVFTDWIGRSKQVNALKQEMMIHSPFAYGRMIGGTSEAQLYITDNMLEQFPIKIKGKPIAKADLLKYINSADTATGAMIWSAAKMQVENEEGIQSGDPRYWQRVEDIYMQAVIESQSSNDEWQRSAYAKRANVINKTLSVFAGQSFSNFNGFMGRVIEAINDPNPMTRMRLFKSFMHVFVSSAIMTAAVDTLRYGLLSAPDDDEEEDFFLQALTRGSYQNIPVLSPVIDAAVNKYRNPVFGRDLSHPAIEVMNSGAEILANAARGREERAIQELVRFSASLTGVPTIAVTVGEKLITE